MRPFEFRAHAAECEPTLAARISMPADSLRYSSMHRRSNPDPRTGDALRDEAADLLSVQYGQTKTEYRAAGKKTDVYFEYNELGKKTRIFLEAKDYEKPLGRSDVVHIKADYEGIINSNSPALLLIVTRMGLTADAQSYVDAEISTLRHQTIWEIESNVIDFEGYLRHLSSSAQTKGLDSYYIESGFNIRDSSDPAHADHISTTRRLFDDRVSCYLNLVDWAEKEKEEDYDPVAILGGYGTGKSSLATMLSAYLANEALKNPRARKPVLLRLGGVSQYSSIEGLLGSHFTNEYPVKNFNCHTFLGLNRKGKFLIILDGFDEMKHSMSWSDFKAQVKNLLSLQGGMSKVLLLGRPSAFLSDLEERHILKGERPFDDKWVRLPDWPRFHELELSDFTKDERREFITKYLRHASGRSSEETLQDRAGLANSIADNDSSLFARPVHSKILTDLATDPNFDLEVFATESSRWLLYEEFVYSLYERELEKRSRSDISTERRIEFIQDLAFWLWTERGAKISFSVDEIPPLFVPSAPQANPDEVRSLTRELLVGSLLERKLADVFFFGHRSFAEFIVASRLLRSVPEPQQHEAYSKVFRDGVATFLEESGRKSDVRSWVETFGMCSGRIGQAYIDFMGRAHGSLATFCEALSQMSVWKRILEPFAQSLEPNRENYDAVLAHMLQSESSSFAWHYCWLAQFDSERWRAAAGAPGRGMGRFDQAIFLSLINSLFSNLQNNDRTLFVGASHVGLRNICREALTLYEFEGRAQFEWSHRQLANACQKELLRCGAQWEVDLDLEARPISIMVDEIFEKLSLKAQENLLIYLQHIQSWASITERAEATNRRKQINRSPKPTQRHRFSPKGITGKPSRRTH